ncbi:MAG: preprotein translocase subunit SecE [Dehalococcoidia bacterium]
MPRTDRRRMEGSSSASTSEASRSVRANLPRPSAPAPRAEGQLAGPTRATAPRKSPFGFFKKLTPRFAADIIAELRKVTWPTFQETRYLTIVVAAVSVAVGIILGLLDLFFGWAVEQLFF